MNVERFVMTDFPGGILGWGSLAAFAGSAVFTFWFVVVRGIIGMKVRDPEWRRLADVWSWVGVGLGAAAVVAASGFALLVVAANVAWYANR